MDELREYIKHRRGSWPLDLGDTLLRMLDRQADTSEPDMRLDPVCECEKPTPDPENPWCRNCGQTLTSEPEPAGDSGELPVPAEHPCDQCDKPAGKHRCNGCENRNLLPLPKDEESWQCPACQGWSNADAAMCIRPGCGEARPEQAVRNVMGCSLCQTPLDEWGNPVPCPHCATLEAENTRLRGEVIKLRQEVWNNREEIESLQDQRQEWIDLCATLRGDRDILIAAVMDANYFKIFGLADTHAEAIALAEETQRWICSECGYPNDATDKTCVSSACTPIEEAKEVGDE